MNWDNYFKDLVAVIASKSKDRSTKVGCVIVGPDNEIRATGFNGFPRNINDDEEDRHQRPEKYFWTEHAERNAIFAAARVGTPTAGCRLYLTWFPCMDCARAIIQAGIVEIIANEPDHNDKQWGEQFKKVYILLAEGQVKVRFYGHN